MGKRSDFDRLERDYYKTPKAAIVPLIPHSPKEAFTYWEPCAGNGQLVRYLSELKSDATCYFASDIEPDIKAIEKMDAFDMIKPSLDTAGIDYIITNPPWARDKKHDFILHRMIEHFSSMRPTWLLFDADWAHTKQAHPYLEYCHKIVSVGRVKWFPDTNMTGKDNCAWSLFDQGVEATNTAFYGRIVK